VSGAQAPLRQLELWPAPGGAWRWRYVEEPPAGERTILVSNTAYLSLDEAERAARSAYPGLPLRRSRSAESRLHRRQRRARLEVTVFSLVVVLSVVLRLLRGNAGAGSSP
jgi:hypothetical protein